MPREHPFRILLMHMLTHAHERKGDKMTTIGLPTNGKANHLPEKEPAVKAADQLTDDELLAGFIEGYHRLSKHERWHAYFIANRAISHLRRNLDAWPSMN